jgi:hypothetical protein
LLRKVICLQNASHWLQNLITQKETLKDSEDIKTDEKSDFFTYDPFSPQKLVA